MKHYTIQIIQIVGWIAIVFIAVFLCKCSDTITITESAEGYTEIVVEAGNQYVEDIPISVYQNGRIVWYGMLPFEAALSSGDSALIYFEVDVSNFRVNHITCDCEGVGSWSYCTQKYFVCDTCLTWIVAPEVSIYDQEVL